MASSPQDWFTVAVSPAPPGFTVDYTSGHGTTRGSGLVVLLLQHRFPVDEFRRRKAGTDWTDSRVVVGYSPDGREFEVLDDPEPDW